MTLQREKTTMTREQAHTPDHEVVIIGAGFGGMGAGIKLKQAGIEDFMILERRDEVGGTWRDNTYPGVAVDIPSFTYSYHFEPNPNWSRPFAPGKELQEYAVHVADKYGLRPHLRFGVEVGSARFDEAADCWRLELADGSALSSRFLMSCHGTLVTPSVPTIPGLADFEGTIIQTMAWDHDHDLTDERVAVIGTGASGIQVIPAIADTVKSMQVYQRTPIWVLPKTNPELNTLTQKIFEHVPLVQRSLRVATGAFTEIVVVLGAVYNRELPFVVKGIEQGCLAYLRSEVSDPELREKLTPRYGFGCKRPSFSDTYYAALQREHVELVTDGIQTVTPTGIRTVDGIEREVDTIVLATGFKVFDVPYDLYGIDGVTLEDRWDRERRESYEGVSLRGYPNMFLAPGPYGVTGASWFATVDVCTSHAVRVITEARARSATRVEVSRTAQDRYMRKVLARMGNTMFKSPACAGSNSYYIDKHGDASLARPTPGVQAWWAQRRFDLNDYEFRGHGSFAAVLRSPAMEDIAGHR
ncbi:NAD(P)/FAD-dependent oxidoreductase [Nocardia sp. NPDC052001]|uniref:flavin-containing monooxygenase n=1 Tax=Nocardia sp. NPDC052001 TaxID=3154853 RepID=UPI00342A8A75